MNSNIKKFDGQTDELNFNFSYNDSETATLHAEINHNTLININDLRRISLWKINRVIGVSDEALDLLRRIAGSQSLKIDDDIVEQAINALVNSQGIGFPMASAILKFINPDVFPIIDIRAYRALTGKKLNYSTYSYSVYIEYVKSLMEIAVATRRPLREIDEQLYCFDKKINGKI